MADEILPPAVYTPAVLEAKAPCGCLNALQIPLVGISSAVKNPEKMCYSLPTKEHNTFFRALASHGANYGHLFEAELDNMDGGKNARIRPKPTSRISRKFRIRGFGLAYQGRKLFFCALAPLGGEISLVRQLSIAPDN